MLRPSFQCLVLFFLLFSFGCASVHPNERFAQMAEVDELVDRDLWYGLFSGDQRVGWCRLRSYLVEESYNNKATLRYRIDNSLTVKLKTSSIPSLYKSMERIEFELNASQRLVTSKFITGVGEQVNKSIVLSAEALGYVGTFFDSGTRKKMNLLAPPFVLADALMPDRWLNTQPAVGESLVVNDFSTERLEPFAAKYFILSRQNGQARVRYSRLDGSQPVEFLYVDGEIQEMYLAGGLVQRRESQEQAQRVKGVLDLFEQMMVPLDSKLGSTKKLVRLELSLPNNSQVPTNSWQRQQNELWILERDSYQALDKDQPEDPVSVNLSRSSLDYPSDDPEFQLLLNSVNFSGSDLHQLSQLVNFVSDYVVDELQPVARPVRELLTDPRGDCTEHARLLVTLARAKGWPAREIYGLVYLGDSHQAMGPHMWAEVFAGGRWRAVDPALNQTPNHVDHLALASGGENKIEAAPEPLKGIIRVVLKK